MYANVRSRNFKPRMVPEVAKRIEGGVIPIINKIPGFVSFTLAQTSPNRITIMGVCETEEAAKEAGPKAIAWVDQNCSDLVDGPPDVTNGPILVYHHK